MPALSASVFDTFFEQCEWCRTTGEENQRLRLELSRVKLAMLERPAPLALVPATGAKVISIKKRARRSKLDLSDEACLARYAEAREKGFWPNKPLSEVVRSLCGWSDLNRGRDPVSGGAVDRRCDWCLAVLAKGVTAQRCTDCATHIATKSRVWSTVNDQKMSYDEAMAAQA